MKKLIKMTLVAVGAATMFAGCGEQDPAKTVATTLKEVRAELVNAGATSFANDAFPEDGISGLEAGTLSEREKKMAMSIGEKVSSALPRFKKYMGIMKEIKCLDSTIFKEFFDRERFLLKSTAEEQDKMLDEAGKKLAQLKALKSAM